MVTSTLSEPAALDTLQEYIPPSVELSMEILTVPTFPTSLLSLTLVQIKTLSGPPRAAQVSVNISPTRLFLMMGIAKTLPSGDTATEIKKIMPL